MERHLSFSQRNGLVPIPETMIIESISPELRNTLWNIATMYIFEQKEWKFRAKTVWADILKKPLDDLKYWNSNLCRAQIREKYDSFEWNEVFDFIESIVRAFEVREIMHKEINSIFFELFIGYRMVDNQIIPITDDQEIASIKESIALSNGRFSGAATHISTALSLLSKRPDPDYRNSIKESISAIESIMKELTNDRNATLTSALKTLDATMNFHPAFRQAIEKLYGYAGDESGIRHSIFGEVNVGFAEAQYMLVICSALVNFLKVKADEAGMLS